MGSLFIWIAASIAYGAVSAAIYLFICTRLKLTRLRLRAAIAFPCFTLLALFIALTLWTFFRT